MFYSLWVSRTGTASDWCALQEVLYKCIDTIQYNITNQAIISTSLPRHATCTFRGLDLGGDCIDFVRIFLNLLTVKNVAGVRTWNLHPLSPNE